MTPPRSEPINGETSRQTDTTGGCLSGFLIPPLIALCFGLFLAVSTGGFNGIALPRAYATPLAGSATIAPLFTPEVQYWAGSIFHWAEEHGVDPNLAATIMQIESCGNPSARSSAGAAGLFQVMPYHFSSHENIYDPDTNALRGLGYLRSSLEKSGGDVRLALAGYNGGIGVINRAESSWAHETRRYAYWGSGIYADAAQSATESSRLNEWLAAGGASLCRKARQNLGMQ